MTPVAFMIIIPLTTAFIAATIAWLTVRRELRDWDRYVVSAAARRVEEARREAQYFKDICDEMDSEDLRDERILRKLQIAALENINKRNPNGDYHD